MSLKEQLQNDLKEAMKSKDNFKRDTIRNGIMSPIKQIEVDERRELSDDDVIKLIQKAIKQRDDAIEQYKSANREDLADKEQKEIDVLISYMPKQLNDDELKSIIEEIIKRVEASSMKDIGKVMGVATKELTNRADGKRINQMAKGLLS